MMIFHIHAETDRGGHACAFVKAADVEMAKEMVADWCDIQGHFVIGYTLAESDAEMFKWLLVRNEVLGFRKEILIDPRIRVQSYLS